MKDLITTKLDVVMFTIGVVSIICLSYYTIYKMMIGDYYMTF